MFESLRGKDFSSDSVGPSDMDGSARSVDASDLRAEIEEVRKTRSDKGKTRGKRRVGVGAELTQEEVDSLFTPKNWEAITQLPFRARYAMTGFAGFLLTEEETDQLSQTTAMTMKILLKVDPKYIALGIWGFMFAGTWAAKEAQYGTWKAAQVKSKKPVENPVESGAGRFPGDFGGGRAV